MKKIILFILAYILFIPLSYGENYLFPLPIDTWNVTNAYQRDGAYDTHWGAKAQYSIDFQLESFKNREKKFNGFYDKCYSLGAPVLSTRPGKVLAQIIPVSKEKLNSGYGYGIKVGYPDGSYTFYGHMLENTFAVNENEEVEAGQILGLLGATGNTKGGNCRWENNFDFQKDNHGPHLHMETNTSAKLAVLQEPLVGQEQYTEIKAVQPYISETKMLDPHDHWAEWESKVPYQLSYTHIPHQPPKLTSFTPLTVQPGERVFTLKGERMPSNVQIELPGCNAGEWLPVPEGKSGSEERRYKCYMNKLAGSRTGRIFIPLNEGDDPRDQVAMNLEIDVLLEGEIALETSVQTVSIPSGTKPGEVMDIQISGQNLPGDLLVDTTACQDIVYLLRGTQKQIARCTLAKNVYSKDGQLMDGILKHAIKIRDGSGKVLATQSVTLDHRIRVNSISPAVAYYGQKTQFTLKGEGMNLLNAAHIGGCDSLAILSSSATQLTLECIPLLPKELLSPL